MTSSQFLPPFDPRSIPVQGVDDHLAPVPAHRLTPDALRQRFASPPVWVSEHTAEAKLDNRQPWPAAVLIPLVMRGDLMLLLTERTAKLSTHAGQIAFPGGRVDTSDMDAVDTALREAREEVGLQPDCAEVLGSLPTYVTGTAYSITPVVALIRPDAQFKPNPDEVAAIFEVPLAYLMNPANHQHHQAVFEGLTRHWLSMPYLDAANGAGLTPEALLTERYIWGATAGMLRNLYRFLSA